MTIQMQSWPAESRTLDDALFGDGLVMRCFVAAAPRKHGAFQYAARMMTPEEVATAEHAVRTAAQTSKAKAVAVMAKTISQQITWTAATGGPLTVEQASRLHDSIFNRVWFQLLGEIPMDESPEAEPTTATDELRAVLGE